jgi:hypothetical protein
MLGSVTTRPEFRMQKSRLLILALATVFIAGPSLAQKTSAVNTTAFGASPGKPQHKAGKAAGKPITVPAGAATKPIHLKKLGLTRADPPGTPQ